MKRNVRIFSMLLALVCVISMLPVMAVSAETAESAGLVDLSSYEDGATYTAADGTAYTVVKEPDTFKSLGTVSTNIILGADIDCNTTTWTVINLNGKNLDGNGYAIYGIDVTYDNDLYLFKAGNGTVVKNLTVGLPENKIQMTCNKETAGASNGVLMGYEGSKTITFDNVTVYADYTSSKGSSGIFVGNFAGGTLKFNNCRAYGSMTDNGGYGCGGFVGKVDGNSTVEFSKCGNYATVQNYNGKTGGFVGELNWKTTSVSILDCVNEGSVNNQGHTGGFVGGINPTADNAKGSFTFTNCVNRGSVNSNNSHTGGFIGNITPGKTGAEGVVSITNCVNKGSVNGNYVGGFIGVHQQSSGTLTTTISQSVNEGYMKGQQVGGFVGYLNSNNASTSVETASSKLYIENCVNTGDVESGKYAAGFVGYLAHKFCLLSCVNSVNLGEIRATGSGSAAGFTFRNCSGFSVDNCGSYGMVTAADNTSFGVLTVDFGWGMKSAKNLYYTEIENAKDLSKISGYSGGGTKTLAEGIAWTNTLLGDKVGKVIMNNDATGAVLASPTFAGVQEATKTAGKIRLVATLNDSLNYSEVGFKVTLVGGETVVKSCNEVYRKLLTTTEDGFQAEVTANELYGAYVFALSIENIPVSDTPVTLIVTPYGKDANDSTVEYAGASYEVVYTGGKVVSINACA